MDSLVWTIKKALKFSAALFYAAKNQQVKSVKGTDGYPHMPILRPLAARRFVRFWATGAAKFP